MEIRYNFTMRKIIVALILLLAIVFVFVRFSELTDFLNTLHHSNYRFLIAAFIFELIWMFNSATDYGSIYHLVGLKRKNISSGTGSHGCQFCQCSCTQCRHRRNGSLPG